MAKFVFFNAVDGAVQVSVERKVVGTARTVNLLAMLLIANGVTQSDDLFCSSDVDFASEEGFDDDDAAHELISNAIAKLKA